MVLFELLTGTKPHEGETPIQVAYKHVHDDVPPPSSLVPELPAYVDALVARATARDRGLRPADAAVLLHQVHRVSHALDDGVPDDPELTADLTPVLLSSSGGRAPSPDVWDDAELAEILEPQPSVREPDVSEPSEREHTTTYPDGERRLPRARPSSRSPTRAASAAVPPRPGAAGAGPAAGAARRRRRLLARVRRATPRRPACSG